MVWPSTADSDTREVVRGGQATPPCPAGRRQSIYSAGGTDGIPAPVHQERLSGVAGAGRQPALWAALLTANACYGHWLNQSCQELGGIFDF